MSASDQNQIEIVRVCFQFKIQYYKTMLCHCCLPNMTKHLPYSSVFCSLKSYKGLRLQIIAVEDWPSQIANVELRHMPTNTK